MGESRRSEKAVRGVAWWAWVKKCQKENLSLGNESEE